MLGLGPAIYSFFPGQKSDGVTGDVGRFPVHPTVLQPLKHNFDYGVDYRQ
jgi:hypothetical protein